jgi:hypothetical protein
MDSTVKPKGTPYRTSDIYYAAYLKVAAVNFLGVAREGRRCFFLFENQEGLPDLHLQYFNNVSKVSARSFAEEIKAFKALTHPGE